MIQILSKTCGNVTGIPSKLPTLTSEIFLLIQIAIPVLLVIMGTIDLFKGITANKEDEMVKGRKMFGKRLITGALVFFIIAIVKLVIGAIDSENSPSIIACMDCFISDKCLSTAMIEEIDRQKDNSASFKEWSCTLNGYEFAYHTEGNKFEISPSVNVKGKTMVSFNSNFKPKNVGECPTTDEYVVSIIGNDFDIVTKATANSTTWSCELDSYSIKYNYAGEIYASKANYTLTQFSSEFKPNALGECPSKNQYKVEIVGATTPSTYHFKVVSR